MEKSLKDAAFKIIDALVEDKKIRASVKVRKKDFERLQKSVDRSIDNSMKESVLAEKKGKMKTVDAKDSGKERRVVITADDVGLPKETPEARRERLQTQKRGGVHKNDASRNRRKDKQDIRSGNYDIARRGN